MKIFQKIVIDLGTVNCVVSALGSGVFLSEPTVVALSLADEKVLAVGHKAYEMVGRTPSSIRAVKPLQHGVIADYRVTEALLRYLIGRSLGRVRFFKPEILISVPSGLTSIEKEAVLDAAISAGVRHVYLFPEVLAAALGSGIPIGEPSGSLIVNVGGGTTEVAVVSLGGMVVAESVRLGGEEMNEAVVDYIKRKYGLIVGNRTAEEVKIAIGNALLPAGEKLRETEVKGRSTAHGIPETIKVNEKDIFEALEPVVSGIANAVFSTLEKLPPEISSDILDKGGVLSGGAALLPNFDKFLTAKLGIPIHKADDPINCVVKGLLAIASDMEIFRKHVVGKR